MAGSQDVKERLQDVKEPLQDVKLDAGAMDWVTARVLDVVARDEPVSPAALTFLLGRYAATSRDDLGDVLGRALAAALEQAPAADTLAEQADWTVVFAHAARVSDDPRVRLAATSGVERLSARLGVHGNGDTSNRARAIDACLVAADAIELPDLLAVAVNELERVIAAHYEPGQGMGALEDQISTASALLTAYAMTGRLPYSMLADELIQVALRTPWASLPFERHCEGALVCGRLAALYGDDDYRQRAVTSAGGDYGEAAARVLASQWPRARDDVGAAAAFYGLALAQWLDLQ